MTEFGGKARFEDPRRRRDREVYGDPTAPCWDVVMAVDEAGHDRSLSFSQTAIHDRRRHAAAVRRRRRQAEQQRAVNAAQ